jgi:hypothetical protein
MRHLDASSPREVVICVEFLFQLQSLVTSICLATSPAETIGSCKEKKNTENKHISGSVLVEEGAQGKAPEHETTKEIPGI